MKFLMTELDIIEKVGLKCLNALFIVQVELIAISTALDRRINRRESRNLNMMREPGRFSSVSLENSNRIV